MSISDYIVDCPSLVTPVLVFTYSEDDAHYAAHVHEHALLDVAAGNFATPTLN